MAVDKFDHFSEMEMQEEQHHQSNPALRRQSSIFSLDEFQNTHPEEGKDLGSMDIDEFINSIWNADETEMREEGHAQQIERRRSCTSKIVKNPVSVPAQRQPSIEEMTLEDFVVELGVIPKPCPILPLQQQGLYPNGNNPLDGHGPPGFPPRPILAYPPPATQFTIRETPVVVGSRIRSAYAGGGYGAVEGLAPPEGLAMPAGGGYVIVPGLAPPAGLAAPAGLATPASPISSKRMVGNPVDGPNQAVLETSEARGLKKRSSLEGLSDQVAERKRRRKIKNRASAARSRARKLAHTTEVETALKKLKEENDVLKQRKITALREMQELFKAEKGRKWLNGMRRCNSCTWV